MDRILDPEKLSAADPRRNRSFLRYAVAGIGIAALASFATAMSGEKTTDKSQQSNGAKAANSEEDPLFPRRHFRLKNPADLTGEEAEKIYVSLMAKMARGYATSQIKGAEDYQKWQRYNTVPYLSAAHGRRLVNNYANQIAQAYGKFEQAGKFPVGSMIAKDNVTVNDKGVVNPGALLLMEKMQDGFNYVSGNWRYTMIMPDGSLFGTTNGEGSKKVEFCIACHLAAEKYDHLHFLPKKYRRR